MVYFYLFLCGAFGVGTRYIIATYVPTFAFPWTTLFINVFGSFAIGWLHSLPIEWNKDIYTGLTIGLLGGFTTFSTFSLETILLFRNGQLFWGILNIFSQVVLSLLFCYLGTIIIK